jgi:8-oxo-dGTP diphosphatase
MKQFGIKSSNARYVARPSAYAVLFNAEKKILVVRHKGKYFLPGGGLERGESERAALYREVMEETGLTIRLLSRIGVAGEYVYGEEEQQYYNKIGVFYHCKLEQGECENAEVGHEVAWLSLEEFETGAAHESHVWAMRSLRSFHFKTA